jgi:bcr-type benzoyl-CoA reductase subunit B
MSFSGKLRYLLNVHLIGRTVLALQRRQNERKIARRRWPDDVLAPPFHLSARMKELMSRHYLEGRYANGARKVAWVTSGAPIEILKALGFYILYPENHAALCGARRKVVDIATEAENAGFSRDICSYARTDIGAALSSKTPVGKLPRPDVLLACTNICQTVLYWYRVLADYFRVPLILVDTPFLYREATKNDVAYVKRQLEEMIPVAEQIAGRRLSFKKLKKVVHLSKEASFLWLEVLERGKHRPSPLTAFDGFIHMAPIVDLRGEAVAVEYYRLLLKEIDHRIEKGVSAVKNEKKRLIWDNLPIWFKLRELAHTFARHGANIVTATYTYAWGELAPMMDETRPLESAARTYLHPILNRGTGHKLRAMRKMVEDFSADGVVLHSDRSCKPYSLGQIDQRDYFVNQYGIPALLLEADHNDPRSYSDEQAESRIAAFLEILEG